MRIFFIFLTIATCCQSAVLAGESTVIGPPDVFIHVELVRSELELIRAEMGKPMPTGGAFEVEDAQPREVFFQARTLFKKADRLCFQITRDTMSVPDAPLGLLQPRHVYDMVGAVLARIRRVKKHLGIPERSIKIDRDDSKTPTDVFQSIVEANRQLNLLLDRPFLDQDSFQQVTLAFHHATRLRAHFPGRRIPGEETLERNKQPADVFYRLVRCYEIIRTLSRQSGIEIAKLRPSSLDSEQILPSDVYDLASLVVTELAHLHQLLTGEKPADSSYPPGRKFPSHVYQRAGILESQLRALAKLVEKDPNWLGKKVASP